MTSIHVAMPVNDRPEYLKRSLKSWMYARGSGLLHFHFSIEPKMPADILQVLADFAYAYGLKYDFRIATEQQGVDLNPRRAMILGFRDADYVIYTEDDVVVSTDILEYLAWGGEKYQRQKDVLAICAFELNGRKQPGYARFDREFRPTCFGMWYDRWHPISLGWDFTPRPDYGWDNYVQQAHLMPTGRVVIKPVQSRSQHIGEVGVKAGTPGHGFIQSASFVEEVPPQEYLLA